MRPSWFTTAASSSFSWMVIGSPGTGNLAKRVPPTPRPQVGTATREGLHLVLHQSRWSAAAIELRGRGCVLVLQRGRAAQRSRLDQVLGQGSGGAWRAPIGSAREGLGVAGVDVEDVAGRLGGAVGGEEGHRLGDVLRQHLALQQAALAVVRLQRLAGIDAVGVGALLAPVAVPYARAADAPRPD